MITTPRPVETKMRARSYSGIGAGGLLSYHTPVFQRIQEPMTSEDLSNRRCIKLLAGLKYVTVTTAYIIRKGCWGIFYTAILVEGPKLGIMLVSILPSFFFLRPEEYAYKLGNTAGTKRGEKYTGFHSTMIELAKNVCLCPLCRSPSPKFTGPPQQELPNPFI